MPEFRAGKPYTRLTLTADVVLTSGEHALLWDSEQGDGDYVYDGAVGSWTAGRRGLYLQHVTVARAAAATNGLCVAKLLVNGTEFRTARHVSNAAQLQVPLTTLLHLEEGDVLTWRTQLHATASATMRSADTEAFLVRVGPWRWT